MKITIPPPIVTLACGALMYGSDQAIAIKFNHALLNGAALILLTGAAIILALSWAQFIKEKTTVNPIKPHKASTLVIEGLYRYSRNPMYLGMAMCLAAFALFLGNPVSILGVVVFVVYMNVLQIRPEEAAMSELFGSDYEAYKSKVRRWL